ncbi:biopolymer transporter ExbD [Crenothrix sp. D3]|jgi:biopolymer transport protein ExbD|nr:biopolymer transporter ExbD [Crenothrix sp. D3]
MAFKPQGESSEAMSEINVTPLVDVMLVLVIILLVTAPLVTQSVHMKLPETAETTADIDKQPFQLAINAKNEITLNKIPYANLVDLETALKAELAKNPEMEIHLHADESIVYGKVAELMATVQHAGIVKMAFVTVEQ